MFLNNWVAAIQAKMTATVFWGLSVWHLIVLCLVAAAFAACTGAITYAIGVAKKNKTAQVQKVETKVQKAQAKVLSDDECRTIPFDERCEQYRAKLAAKPAY